MARSPFTLDQSPSARAFHRLLGLGRRLPSEVPSDDQSKKVTAEQLDHEIDLSRAKCCQLPDERWGVYLEGRLLKAKCGRPLVWTDRRVLDRMIEEFKVEGKRIAPDDCIQNYQLFILTYFDSLLHVIDEPPGYVGDELWLAETLRCDGAFRLVAGPESVEQYALLEPVVEFLASRGVEWTDNDSSWTPGSALIGSVANLLSSYTLPQIAVLDALKQFHEGGLVVPAALAAQAITAEQYAEAALAERALIPAFGDVTVREYRRARGEWARHAQFALEFLDCFKVR